MDLERKMRLADPDWEKNWKKDFEEKKEIIQRVLGDCFVFNGCDAFPTDYGILIIPHEQKKIKRKLHRRKKT